MKASEIRLPLKRQWFEMTASGVKTEEYREVNEYWAKRLVDEYEFGRDGDYHLITMIALLKFKSFKKFSHNVMTLGYPKANDTSRIIKYEHAGIELRTGNPDWGAEPGKIYFVIKHGKRIG